VMRKLKVVFIGGAARLWGPSVASVRSAENGGWSFGEGPLPWGIPTPPPLTRCVVGPHESSLKTASRSAQPFVHSPLQRMSKITTFTHFVVCCRFFSEVGLLFSCRKIFVAQFGAPGTSAWGPGSFNCLDFRFHCHWFSCRQLPLYASLIK